MWLHWLDADQDRAGTDLLLAEMLLSLSHSHTNFNISEGWDLTQTGLAPKR
jgi:hypothetical protein